MPVDLRARNPRTGAAAVEFALASVILVPLFFGTLALGLNLGRSVQVTQVSRDLASMYSRSADFSSAAAQSLAQRLASGLDVTSGGDVVIVFSQVMVVQEADCVAGGYTSGCANQGQPVFVNRIVLGNQSLRASNFGTPSGMNAKGNIPASTYLTDPTSRGNSALAAELSTAGIAQRQGEIAYIVEAWFDTPSLNPFGTVATGGVYATSIF